MAYKVVIRPVGGQKGLVYITTERGGGSPPVITMPDGTSVTGVKASSIGRSWVENTPSGMQYQWVFPNFTSYGQPVTVSSGGQSKQMVLSPSTEYRTENGGLAGVDQAPNKSAYGGMGGVGGVMVNGNVAMPIDLTSQFPTAVTIPVPAYNFTNPMEFAKEYADFQKGQIKDSFELARQMTDQAMKDEQRILGEYIPEAAARKRQETAADNVFNQMTRTQQLESTIPDVLEDQDQQAADARTYASGRLTDEVTDAALSLDTRSSAADMANASGFGARSSAARVLSDQLSARERFQISQYGQQLKGQSIQDRANLRLAPTSYSNAGQQVNVNPTVSPTQLTQATTTTALNQMGIPTTTALASTTQQEQFKTTTELDVSKFNATNQNTFALQKFGYMAQLANATQQAVQGGINQELSQQQQQAALGTFKEGLKEAQRTGNVAAATSIIGAILSASGLGKEVVDWVKSSLGLGGDKSTGDSGGNTGGSNNGDVPVITPSQGSGSEPVGSQEPSDEDAPVFTPPPGQGSEPVGDDIFDDHDTNYNYHFPESTSDFSSQVLLRGFYSIYRRP